MRSRAWMLVLLSACYTQSAPPPPPVANAAPAPKRATTAISGDYRAAHTIQMVCHDEQAQNADGWCEEEGEDTMTIREQPSGNIDVVIELVRTNAHTCSFEGALERTVDGRGGARRWRFQSEEEEFPCTLVLEQAGRRVTVRAEGCREYCGVRASLDAEFDFPPPARRPG